MLGSKFGYHGYFEIKWRDNCNIYLGFNSLRFLQG